MHGLNPKVYLPYYFMQKTEVSLLFKSSQQNGVHEKILYLDPSEHLRPEKSFADKPLNAFRDYSIDSSDPIKERVRLTYEMMHTNQTVEFVRDRIQRWTKFNTFKVRQGRRSVRIKFCNKKVVKILRKDFTPASLLALPE